MIILQKKRYEFILQRNQKMFNSFLFFNLFFNYMQSHTENIFLFNNCLQYAYKYCISKVEQVKFEITIFLNRNDSYWSEVLCCLAKKQDRKKYVQ